jgi:hypothetical protein
MMRMNPFAFCSLALLGFLCGGGTLVAETSPDRGVWLAKLQRIAEPVLTNLAAGTLRANLPKGRGHVDAYAPLEATGRLLCGISAWMELPADTATEEGRLRERYLALAHKGLSNAFNPQSPDYQTFNEGAQPLVDAAFLAEGFLRSPKRLWGGLDESSKQRVLAEFKGLRRVKPYESNWLLFGSVIEAFLLDQTGECDSARLNHGVDAFMKRGWYKGDGVYGDGANFHFDYYNSFVIHPLLTDCLAVMERRGLPDAAKFREQEQARLRRYADEQERLVSPEGTFPVTGRSIVYRFGAFHALAQAVLLGREYHGAPNGAIRAAMTAVLKNQTGDRNFDKAGWLVIGFNGDQPKAAEGYISHGSPYLCAAFFLPLGLPADNPFWTDAPQDWTSKRAWAGEPFVADHAIGN